MICVDASVAAKWVLPEEYSDKALALVTATVQARQPIVAPPLLPIEVTNIIRQRMVRANLSLEDARQMLTRFFRFPLTIREPPRLYLLALETSDEHDLPAAYDAHYVALAQLLGCPLWTDDRRLLRALGGRLPFVRWIGDYTEDQPL